MIKTSLFLSLAAIVLSNSALADDRSAILDTIRLLTDGVDTQDGAMLSDAFHEDAAIFATSPDGTELVALPAAAFAKVHAEKRFGGQTRSATVANLDITEGLIANAKVIAENDAVHYTYYLGLVKLDGDWKIQNFLQRSRPVDD
ncbi:MAG: nuclear transport factor 2 family protein [Pseudomonadota bacterium]